MELTPPSHESRIKRDGPDIDDASVSHKRVKTSEIDTNFHFNDQTSIVEDIRGRDPRGNVERLKSLIESSLKEANQNKRCNIEIEARFGEMKQKFESGFSENDFFSLLRLLDDHISSNPGLIDKEVLEETNYIYKRPRGNFRITKTKKNELFADSKTNLKNELFTGLSSQALYVLKVNCSKEEPSEAPNGVEDGYAMTRQKMRYKYCLKGCDWQIHATKVITLDLEVNRPTTSYEMELELPLMTSKDVMVEESKQNVLKMMNSLNEGISFLLHLLICVRTQKPTIHWKRPELLDEYLNESSKSDLNQNNSFLKDSSSDSVYTPHQNLHSDSFYQKPPPEHEPSLNDQKSTLNLPNYSKNEDSSSYLSSSGSMPSNTSNYQYQQPSYAPEQHQSYQAAPVSHYAPTYSNASFQPPTNQYQPSQYGYPPSHSYGSHYPNGATNDFPSIRMPLVSDQNLVSAMSRFISNCRPFNPQQPHQNKHFKGFVGTMPISFSRRYLEVVLNEDYHISEKTDGVRYLMLISQEFGGVYLIDRTNRFYFVTDFSYSGISEVFDGTILDGEMVHHFKTGQPYFLLFDCLMYMRTNVCDRFLDERLKEIGTFVARFRHKFPDVSRHPFGILGKSIFPKSKIMQVRQSIFEDPVTGKRTFKDGDGSKRYHLTDGLIFTPTRLPYTFGTCMTMFKWKYVDLQSIDFLLRFENPPSQNDIHPNASASVRRIELNINMNQGKFSRCKTTELHVDDFLKLMGDLYQNGFSPTSNSIIAEMAFDPKEALWRYHRLRTDKTSPNHISIAFDTMEAIAENLTLDEIVARITGKMPPEQQESSFN